MFIIQLSEKVLEKCPEVKVLFTPGYTDEAIVHHGVLDEGVFFIFKPFSTRDLRQRVRKVLDSAQIKCE